MEIYDIIIIGAGPVGMYTAFFAELRQAKVKIIESLGAVGGQPAFLYPEKMIYDIPAYPQISGYHLTEALIHQLNRFNTPIALNEKVLSIQKDTQNIFHITTSLGIHYAKSIIIAIGNGAFKPRKLKLPQAEHYESSNLHYFISDLNRFKDQNVVICGGGDSAVDWACTLNNIAKSVTIVHRRNQFRALETSVETLKNSSVTIKTPYVPIKLHGDNSRITHLEISNDRGKTSELLELDHLIINYGFSSSVGNLNEWGITTQQSFIPVNASLETNIPGIFAIGDVAEYPGKVRIIATGFGEGPTAVGNAIAFFNPDASRQHLHSTSLFETN